MTLHELPTLEGVVTGQPPAVDPSGPDDVASAFERHGYLPDEALATVVFLALRMQRPLFLEGEAGVGKTEVAKVLARWTGGELLRLQCYDGIDVAQAIYEWDYARQLLHLRGAEVAGRGRCRGGRSRTSCSPSASWSAGPCSGPSPTRRAAAATRSC